MNRKAVQASGRAGLGEEIEGESVGVVNLNTLSKKFNLCFTSVIGNIKNLN
jgi:hypothetical protein